MRCKHLLILAYRINIIDIIVELRDDCSCFHYYLKLIIEGRMMNKKLLIISESIFNNNTKILAHAMADELDCLCVTVDEAKLLNIDDYEVVGFGSGIYFGKHSSKIIDFVNQLPIKEQKVFIFSTHGNPFANNYHQVLKLALVDRGRTVLGEFDTAAYDGTGPFLIFCGGNKGRPNQTDCKRARRFIKRLLPEHSVVDLYENKLKTKNKVVEGKPNIYEVDSNILCGDKVSVNHNKCIGCCKCVKNCPLSVFEMSNGKAIPIRELDCIYCGICKKYCDTKAITLHGNNYDYIRVAIRHRKKQGI